MTKVFTGAALLIGALAAALRLEFSLVHSRSVPVYDAATYWSLGGAVRAYWLGRPDGRSPLELAAFTQYGIFPTLIACVRSMLPDRPQSLYAIHAGLDALVCVMLIDIGCRLGLPRWAALLAGFAYATYVPGIIGTAAVLQQPLLRFLLTAAAWACAHALTSQHRTPAWTWLATSACVAAGFTTVMTRPLIWLVPLVVLASAMKQPSLARLRTAQGFGVGVMAATLCVLAIVAPATMGLSERARFVLTGFPGKGEVAYTVSVLSFEHFWPPDEWSTFQKGLDRGLAAELLGSSPFALLRIVRGVFENWRYPDNLYLQRFLLDELMMVKLHQLLGVVGAMGLCCLLARAGPARVVALVMLVIVGYSSLAYGLVSVEPRRLASVQPLICLGAAAASAALVGAVSRLIRSKTALAGLGFLAADFLVGWPVLLRSSPGHPTAVHAFWLVCWYVAIIALPAIVWCWRIDRPLVWLAPAALWIGVATLMVLGRFMEEGWRTFTYATSAVTQRLTPAITAPAAGWRWLVLDLERPDSAVRSEIHVDDRVIKRCGEPAWRFRPGAPLRWRTYEEFVRMSHDQEPPATWLALPIPDGIGVPGTVAIRACEGEVRIRGDYARLDGLYPGPLFEPWETSLFRWLWNGEDPRYPVPRAASESQTALAEAGELADHRVLRIAIANLPFGAPSNVAERTGDADEFMTTCPRGELAGSMADPTLLVCRTPLGRFLFYGPERRLIGARELRFSSDGAAFPKTLGRIEGPTHGVEVIQVLEGLAFAHFRERDERLLGSIAFATRPQ
jgi:hypothetical protein